MGILDRTVPNLRRPWRQSLPGVGFIVVIWLASIPAFNFHAQHLGAFFDPDGLDLPSEPDILIWGGDQLRIVEDENQRDSHVSTGFAVELR